ncbi:sulfatase-like hydrolase/transferase [Christiangramia crocea]|uniref:Sulfatase-like hydrolase/transferase n=1 Tax=Christiangramia crocea TaxID=2904124 RepID=A0A9X2A6I1_9FLAO|nr:sulfatase-like hydrolase/transferase [Gramella crocea]MCG9970008.1 sulfatase-like hydrolase/transferase [Gramella crocea]
MKNSQFYLKFIIFLILLAGVGCEGSSKEESKVRSDSKPNVILIIADDAGWNDVGYHGSEIKTPNIDNLAKNGVQLNRFYVYPTCSPTRASLITGLPASRLGIVAPISGRSEMTLPDSIRTLPQILQRGGYSTALLGKWHLGLKAKSGPSAYGFDYSYGFLHGQIDQYEHTYKNGDSSWHRNGSFITEEGHVTDLLGAEAIEWIDRKSSDSSPFFLQLAYSAPHVPLQEPKKWREIYRQIVTDSSRLDYAAAMTHMDQSIGNVLQKIQEENLEDDTIIIFISDNGAQKNWYPDTQYNGRFGPNPTLGSNYPFRDYKTSNYEGGIRVPALIYWKNHLSSGINNNYISVIDLMPTILYMTGIQSSVPYGEGTNMWNSIADKKNIPNTIYTRGHLQESIIKNPWKLIRTRHLEGPSDFELYNIEKDPEEQKNRISENPEIFSKLKDLMQKQFTLDPQEVNVGLGITN